MTRTKTKTPPRQITFTPEEAVIGKRIERQFRVMSKLTELMIKGKVRSLILSGAAGIGKSYNLEERLEQAIDHNEIGQFTILKGKISAIALFKQLWDHREEGDILVLDDIDVVFQDDVSLNILKAALDTGKRRVLHWLTLNQWLAEQGVDHEFEFNGSIAFLTNLNFDRLIERGSILSPHLKALINRSNYLDLGIHTNQEILIRIKQVIETSGILKMNGIGEAQKWVMLDWLEKHYNNMRELSLRSILKLSAYMSGDPDDWEDIAEATMLRGVTYTIADIQAEIDAEEASRKAAAAEQQKQEKAVEQALENGEKPDNVIQLAAAAA